MNHPSPETARDIYTEPEEIDPFTLRNLGPLAPLAGTWEGSGPALNPAAEVADAERASG